MDAQTESRLLRLAIARGLLSWEDLDALPGDGAVERAGDGSPLGGRFIQTLVASGKLDLADVLELLAEHERTREEQTPDLAPGASSASIWSGDLGWLKSWQRYKIEHFLGAGGMGSVYLAFDPHLGRHVALKFLNRNDPELTSRFLREARAQARLDHPNVCQVYEAGEVEGRPYIAMQYVEGRSLSELKGTLTDEQVVRILADVARAVHAAHLRGLIHRDLKPGNILVAKGERGEHHPFVVDFGLAQDQGADTGLTRTGLINGTPAYVSPEQAQGEPLDARSDLYSLGVLLYELLGGQPPLLGANPAMTLVAIVQEDPKPLSKLAPETPRDLETIAMKCLEKSPARRYDTARSLAEDLERFLDGEPILARPSGWGYRLGKRLQKNRPLAAVTAVALLALLALGGFAARTSLASRERAELARRFGQRVEALENRWRYEARLPRHDLSGRKAELRRELEEIEREMKLLGAVGDGPGHYALGRGYLFLGQPAQARVHLEKAWEADYHGAEVAAALGRARGLLYEKSLAEAGRQADPKADPARWEADRRGVQSTYRRPALDILREAAAADPYVSALVAFYEGRYGEAIERARQAYRERPELYEAAQLEADVYATQADEASLSGNYDQARQLYDRARDHYDRLLEVVPSEASLEASACSVAVRRAVMEMTAGPASGGPDAGAVLLHCDRALEIDRAVAEAFRHKARFFWERAASGRGGAPHGDLGQAVAAAREAIARDPDDAVSYTHLANAYRSLSAWEWSQGQDPRAALEQAITASRRAVELQPKLANHRNALGTSYLFAAQVQQQRGLDYRPTIQLATDCYREAVRMSPRHLPAWINLGNAWKLKAEADLERGSDPTAAVRQAAEALEHALTLNPHEARVHNNLGNAHLTLAEFQTASGVDPGPSLSRAAEHYRHALSLRPGYALAHFNLALTLRSQAEASLTRGRDPHPALAAAAAPLAEASQLNPMDADNPLERGRLELIAARWATQQGGDPDPALRRADAALEEARKLNAESAEVYLTQAAVARHRAARRLDRGEAAAAAVESGLAAVSRALAIRPREARALALQGALSELAARQSGDAAKRRQRLEEAAASLREALRSNPLLKRDYADVLARVERGLAAG